MFPWKDKGKKHKLPALFLGLALLGTTVAGPLYADELNDALREQNKIEQKKQEINNRKRELTFKSDRIEKEIKELENQIASASALLEQREKEYNQAQAQVAEAERKLKIAEEEMAKRQEAFSQRLKGLYEYGQVSYLEILFESKSLGDFITRIEYINSLVEYDKKLLASIKEQKAEIEAQKKELEEKRDTIKKKAQQAAQAKAELDQKKAQQQNLLAQNEKELIELAEQSEKLEKESENIKNLIRQLSSQNGGYQGTGSISVWPIAGVYEISSPFGYRIHPITKVRSLHTGIDIPASSGTPIRAAGDGTVIVAGWNNAYGYMVIIDHGGSYSTLYAHQSRMAVSVGSTVKAGQVIGYVGSTGWSTGPHLHFEVRIDGNPTDPLPYYQ